jgi:crotonobetainyl-CoA:carnitine CoA-transferase CaiB-like acyl-CoA transferase
MWRSHQLSYPGTWYLNEKLVTGRAPRSAASDRDAGATVHDRRRLDFRHVHDGKILERIDARDRCTGDRERPAIRHARRTRASIAGALTVALDAVFARDTTTNWLGRSQGVLPAAPVHDLAQALNDNPFPAAIGMIRNTPHPLRPDFKSFANPILLDGARLPARSAPALGADNDAVLDELGYSAEEIAALRAADAI